MTNRLVTLGLVAMLTSVCGAVHAVDDHHKPMKGGIVAPGKEADYELVAKPTVLQLYVQDHGKLRDISKASAKLTLLSGADKHKRSNSSLLATSLKPPARSR